MEIAMKVMKIQLYVAMMVVIVVIRVGLVMEYVIIKTILPLVVTLMEGTAMIKPTNVQTPI